MDKDNNKLEQLLECLIHVIGRAAMPIEKVQEVVGSRGKQIKAFNLLAGNITLADLAKKTKLDRGNLSRTTNRWIENGIVFRIDGGKLMHIYPIPKGSSKKHAPSTRRKRK